MKKTIVSMIMVFGLFGFSQAAVLDDAVGWMHTNGLTIFKTTKDYQPNNYIRRDEAAKFFYNLSLQAGKTNYVNTENECQFSDINDTHKDLKYIVVQSCRLGIFQGSDGKFMPRGQLTNEQAIAVFIRILVGKQSEVGVSYRSENYYKKANELKLLSHVSMASRKVSATRGNVALLIYHYFNQANQDYDNLLDFSDNTLKLGFKYPDTLNISIGTPTDGMIQINNTLGGQNNQLFMVAHNGSQIPEGVGGNFWGWMGQMINKQSYITNFCDDTDTVNNNDVHECVVYTNANGVSYVKYKKDYDVMGSDIINQNTEYLLYNPNSSYRGIILSTEDGISETVLQIIIDSIKFI